MFNLKLAALAVTALVAWSASPASALTMKECGETYQAAKEGGTLNGMDWAAFRKEKCATSAAESVSADSVKTAEPAEKDTSAAVTPTVAPAGVTFPTTLAAEFKTENPAKARMKTCLQGYHDNKEAGTLNGLRWIQKGGGYYSLCNAKLKS
ncbi:hypothetical protein [Mesorhizobium sp.]|uniref:hypothetical protein n=1 Tax=Mesorhizobium sp. TaxID=1871066 RepID=UPI000FEA1266|nr:hypothetical protein [Mesorhizobium sp.]RWE70907.1 MAG: hypothetical protein EOS42_28385 [Mesorhizobium sp.]TIV29703.1 MAG: hypothetical protein E5V90_11345 [Mesorhizobium sp.]